MACLADTVGVAAPFGGGQDVPVVVADVAVLTCSLADIDGKGELDPDLTVLDIDLVEPSATPLQYFSQFLGQQFSERQEEEHVHPPCERQEDHHCPSAVGSAVPSIVG